MTKPLAIDPTQPNAPHFAISQPSTLAPLGLLSDGEADKLLAQLVNSRWSRLACQDTDPLGMLFNDRAKQWTMGWAPDEQALLLVVWETDSWQNKPTWSLYRNGELIIQAIAGQSSLAQQNKFSQLLESPRLPVSTPAEFLARLSDFRFVQDSRQATEQLRQTVTVFPEAIVPIVDALLDLVEVDLGNPEWPTLEVLKLHRLSHKNPLISLFCHWVQQGQMRNAAQLERLGSAITQLQQDYLLLGQNIQPLFQTTYQDAYQEFRLLQTHCLWRLHMRKALPNARSIARPQAQPVSV